MINTDHNFLANNSYCWYLRKFSAIPEIIAVWIFCQHDKSSDSTTHIFESNAWSTIKGNILLLNKQKYISIY